MTEAATDSKATDAKATDTKATDAEATDAKATDAAETAGDGASGADAAEAPAKDAAEAPAKDAAEAPAKERPILPTKVDIQSLQVADEVNCWCGKCKTFRTHTVKLLQPPKPPKSVCLTCRAVHQVRLHEPGTKKARSQGPAMPDVAPWPELVVGVNPDDATKYAMTNDFQVDDFVMHKVFGLGKVIQIGGQQRARVSFESGIKWMLQNHQA